MRYLEVKEHDKDSLFYADGEYANPTVKALVDWGMKMMRMYGEDVRFHLSNNKEKTMIKVTPVTVK
jgi:hypothetical protein